jgi:hypothetical protein
MKWKNDFEELKRSFMKFRLMFLFAIFLLLQQSFIVADYAHGISIKGNFGIILEKGKGVCSVGSGYGPHVYHKCLGNTINIDYPKTGDAFHFGSYNRLEWDEKDPNPPHNITRHCKKAFRLTRENTNIYFHENCIVDIDDRVGQVIHESK